MSFMCACVDRNVLRKNTDLAWRRPGYVEILCTDVSQFKDWSATDIHEATIQQTCLPRHMLPYFCSPTFRLHPPRLL